MKRIKKIYKEQGLKILIIKILNFIKFHIIIKIYNLIKRIIKLIVYKLFYNLLIEIKIFLGQNFIKINEIEKIKNSLKLIIEKKEKYDRIVLWKSSFGWDVHLFQRPQHIAKNFSENKTLYFYESGYKDKVISIKKIQNNLYLVNLNNLIVYKILKKMITSQKKPFYLHIYSTEMQLKVKELKKFIKKGFKILYEYIDDLSPQISGTKELPKNIKEKYEYVMNDEKNCLVIVTADNIEKDVLKYRKKNMAFSCNGVDINHFQNLKRKNALTKDFQSIISKNKPIIGYYGALASWFDYELLKNVAKNTDYEFVLIGVKYDDYYDKQGLNKYKNIHYLGPKAYEDLPYYAKNFDICIIPFIINEITQATSPLKLFEYMALSKPIVTTAMHECKKYKSVLIAEDKQDFILKLKKALMLYKDKKYMNLLNKEATNNTWKSKTMIIIKLLKKFEANNK